ncbi:hypothetical protein FB45DRAFT_788822 [Roridomyces roridus]|uniref:HD/PDEase domain-containing protein n=1 Tax=Roridomyces roridus TaxID=1738132 RepID=A0AAD7C1P5_9AGAR|nr:hypothetical protein FB45DRAFT_788822 [Roridomyces roridus]
MVELLDARSVRSSLKDPIHDYIEVSPLLCTIIDTPQFQRLRHIKQLGTSYRVWAGVSHNRFEHCLGVAHLARQMVQHLHDEQPGLGITDRDMYCVQIAGLCHDLGHGPWSHVWDSLFIPTVAPGKKWKHEDASQMMFRYLLKDNHIEHFCEKDIQFILALIDGDRSLCSSDEKPFLFDIVANKRNGLDVDKFDYILRDSYMMGEPSKISLRRLIKSARVIEDEICYTIKDVNQLHEMCYTRFKYHKMIYNHKTAKAIEYMIVDALILAEPYMKIAEQIEIPEKYLHLTDSIEERIKASTAPELEESRRLFRRIDTRDLYKFVDQRVIEWGQDAVFREHITSERVVQEAKAVATKEGTNIDMSLLTADSVIVDFTTMHYGMKEKNPLDFVKFYSKHNPNKCARAQKNDYSMLMPAVFAEVYLTVFTKHPQYLGLVQAGYRALLTRVPEPDSPATPEPPSTPTRDTSSGTPKRKGLGRTGSISENSFTTVPIDFGTPSKTKKRGRDVGEEGHGEGQREAKRRA